MAKDSSTRSIGATWAQELANSVDAFYASIATADARAEEKRRQAKEYSSERANQMNAEANGERRNGRLQAAQALRADIEQATKAFQGWTGAIASEPLSPEAAVTLEAASRRKILENEFDALVSRYGNSYQASALLSQIAENNGIDTPDTPTMKLMGLQSGFGELSKIAERAASQWSVIDPNGISAALATTETRQWADDVAARADAFEASYGTASDGK